MHSDEELQKITANLYKESTRGTIDDLQKTGEFNINIISESKLEVISCCVCEKERSGAQSCAKCGSNIHIICEIQVESGEGGLRFRSYVSRL